MSTPHDRWRVSLEGERLDVVTLAGELNREIHWRLRDGKEIAFLSLAGIVSTSELVEARASARRYLSDANTSLVVAVPDHIPVRLGPYVEELSPSGESLGFSVTLEPETGYYRRRGRNIHTSPNGVKTLQQPRLAERVLKLRATDANFDAACAVFGTANGDYRLLYVALEYIRDAVKATGGKESRWAALENTGWVEPARLQHFKNTAHTHRHAAPRLQQEMEVREATEVLRQLITALVNERMPA